MQIRKKDYHEFLMKRTRKEMVGSWLILLFPLLSVNIKGTGTIIIVLLALYGIYYSVSNRMNPFIQKKFKLLSLISVGYFAVLLISLIVSNEPTTEYSHIGKKLPFLIAPFIAIGIWSLGKYVALKRIVLYTKIGTIFMGVAVMAQYFLLHMQRPSGMYNANIYGDLAAVMSSMSLVLLDMENRRELILTYSALFFGIFAVAISSSRGSLVSLILTIIVFAFIYNKRIPIHQSKRFLILLAVFVATLFLAFSTVNKINDRMRLVDTQIHQWSTGQNNSSIGIRLEMYRAGLHAFADAPLFGYGYRNSNKVASRYAEDKNTSKLIAGYNHLHNEYITTSVNAGVLGLVALLILLFVPLRVFVNNLNSGGLYYYSAIGILLCVAYASFGLTHMAFDEDTINAFFLFFLSLLMSRVVCGNKYEAKND